MDWTEIITSIIALISALGVAYLGHSVKKDNAVTKEALELSSLRILGEVQQNRNEIRKIRADLDDNNLRTLRLDLLHAIETDPDNVIVIMELAQKYFIDLKGNCYMSKIFQDWASEHHVSVVGIFNR